MARMNKFMLYINDWMSSTMGLEKRAKGCYIDLLCLYYQSGGPIPFGDDGRKELCSKLNYKNMRSMDHDLGLLFKADKIHVLETEDGPVLVNGKATEEIRRYEEIRQGLVKGGETGKPYSKNPRPQPVDNSPETVSVPYRADIEPISGRYRAENDVEIVENQQVSGNSSSSIRLITTTAHAHARGPVEVSIDDDAADQPAPMAVASKIPVQAPASVRGKPSAINPYIGPNAFNRVKPPAEPGTPEWEAEQRKAHRLAVTAEVKKICVEAGVWNEGDEMDSSFIASWLASGADPELHVYPAVRAKAKKLAEKGEKVWGLGIFKFDIGKAIKREQDIAANPNAFADTDKQTSRYSREPAPRLAVTPQAQETIRMALQNKWEDLHDQMVKLLKQGAAGDEQSLRLLNELCAKHAEDVRERYSDWVARKNSSAA